MKHKTADLSGRRLDAAVALACRTAPVSSQPERKADWRPSTDWAQGGPIIDGARITLKASTTPDAQPWYAWTLAPLPGSEGGFQTWGHYGPTLLIAAMRAFVASKLGAEVDLP
jgi:hypothetical protein